MIWEGWAGVGWAVLEGKHEERQTEFSEGLTFLLHFIFTAMDTQ